MRSYANLLTLAAFASLALAKNKVEPDDVPQACRTNTDCLSVFTLSRSCDRTTGDNTGYVNCVCNTSNVGSQLNNCAVCVYQNGGGGLQSDNDVTDLLGDCGLALNLPTSSTISTTSSTTTGSPSLSTSSASITGSQTTLSVTQTSGSTSSATSPSTSRSTSSSTSTSTSASASGTTASQNVAAMPTVMAAGMFIGAAAGLFALA